jgi:hypothetical protein
MNPYKEVTLENLSYRIFSASIDEMELIWHRDAEDRTVEALHTTDWQFQFDNELPITFDKPIFIPKEKIHRVIKGNGDLHILIQKS